MSLPSLNKVIIIIIISLIPSAQNYLVWSVDKSLLFFILLITLCPPFVNFTNSFSLMLDNFWPWYFLTIFNCDKHIYANHSYIFNSHLKMTSRRISDGHFPLCRLVEEKPSTATNLWCDYLFRTGYPLLLWGRGEWEGTWWRGKGEVGRVSFWYSDYKSDLLSILDRNLTCAFVLGCSYVFPHQNRPIPDWPS